MLCQLLTARLQVSPAKVAISWPAGALLGPTWQDILVVVVLAQLNTELLPYDTEKQ